MTKRTPRKTSRSTVKKRSTASALTRRLVAANILFSNIQPRTLRSVLPKLTVRNFRSGQAIFDESARGRYLYLILRGRVRISKSTQSGLEPRLALLHEGDFFGELAILDGHPRSARAESLGSSLVGLLPAHEFRRLITKSPQFAYNLLLTMAIRLRTIDHTFIVELERSAGEAQSKMEQLRLLIEASKTVNSTIDLDHLLELILDAAVLSIRADRGTLYLLDETKEELWAKTVQGNDTAEIRLPLGKGLAGYVAKTGETVNIADAYGDPRFNPEVDKRSGYRTRTVLCMPMRDNHGTIVGVFQLLNKADGVFTSEDEAFIAAYSIHASIALNNAKLVREMVQGERLAAVGRMASQIIHDIRNPMSALRLYVETIRKKSPDKEIVEISEHMISQIDRFIRMAQEILDFSRGVSDMRIEEFGVDELVEAGTDLFAGELRKRNVEFVLENEYHGNCRIDIEKMIRAFYNIAINAMDAMPEGGVFTQRVVREGTNLVVEFSDTGPGIPRELRDKVLQPFFTFGKKHGTGLGLAIVKKIVDDHHGILEILVGRQKGTVIRLALPMDGPDRH